MNTDIKILSLMADLLQAWKNNDLELTKNIIKEINEIKNEEGNSFSFESLLTPYREDFFVMLNDSYVFILENLKFLKSETKKEYKKIILYMEALHSSDKEKAVQLIENFLTLDNSEIDIQTDINHLYQLILKWNLFDYLPRIKEKINN